MLEIIAWDLGLRAMMEAGCNTTANRDSRSLPRENVVPKGLGLRVSTEYGQYTEIA